MLFCWCTADVNGYSAKPLSKVDPGQKVWIKAPSDVSHEGLVLRYDAFPNSVLVQSGGAIYRRNRKHVFPLADESDACPVPLTGNDPDTTVSNDCVALCDDNPRFLIQRLISAR